MVASSVRLLAQARLYASDHATRELIIRCHVAPEAVAESFLERVCCPDAVVEAVELACRRHLS
jgi:hypothetical protein